VAALDREHQVNIYILRHGAAEPRGKTTPDAERRLTKEGRREVKAVVQKARAAGAAPALILTSPLVRAVETAQIAQEALQAGQVTETNALLPDSPPQSVWREIRSHAGAGSILLVGHEPQLSRIAAFLLEAPLAIDLKKGALLRLTVQDHHGPPRGVLKWLLTPRLARH